MAGSLTAAAIQDLLQILQNATGAPSGFSTDLWLNCYNSTLTDAVTLTTTGRLGDNFQVAVDNTTATWTLASATSPSSFQNKVAINVTTAAASTGTVKAFTLQDSSSTGSGNIVAWGDVTPNQTVTTGNSLTFSTGRLVFTLGGGSGT